MANQTKRIKIQNENIKAHRQADKLAKSENPQQGINKTVNNARQIGNSLKDINRAMSEMQSYSKQNKVQSKQDLSKYSDKQLQQIVNRMQLEQRYSQLTYQPQPISIGQKAINWMNTYGNSIITFTTGAVVLAGGIKKIMSK